LENVYVIAGPTASGKTAVAVALAQRIGGEVVSADSMQIYTGMDIGTAKPTAYERDGVPHHMMDIVAPDEPYSAALYQQQARAAIKDIHARGKMPILCGGTGFYINAVLYDVLFDKSDSDELLRTQLTTEAASKSPAYMHEQLQKLDPHAAFAIHPNNVKRVIRALSYCQSTGLLFSQYNATQKKRHSLYNAAFVCLAMDRDILYQRINQRVHAMIDAGLVDEVANLLAKGYCPSLVSMQGIGYKEIVPLLEGRCSHLDAISAIQQNSRHYAKRQMTWFRNQNPTAFNMSLGGMTPMEIAERICKETAVNVIPPRA